LIEKDRVKVVVGGRKRKAVVVVFVARMMRLMMTLRGNPPSLFSPIIEV